MLNTTLLLTLASLGAAPAGPARSVSVAVLERSAGAANLYVPTGAAVPVKRRNHDLRSGELFGQRAAAEGDVVVGTVPGPGGATLQGVMAWRAMALPICRF